MAYSNMAYIISIKIIITSRVRFVNSNETKILRLFRQKSKIVLQNV